MMEETQNSREMDLEKELDHSKTEITFFTDPLCCWSWAFNEQVQKLVSNLEAEISVNYCMCGMIKDWKHSADHLHAIYKPGQMAPLWMQASEKLGISLNQLVWIKDPPSSSYPACIAVKAAEMQSEEAGKALFNKLCDALMLKGRNISEQECIMALAGELTQAGVPMLDIEQFEKDLKSKASRQKFKNDLIKAARNGVERYPTLLIKNSKSKKQVKVVGYRSYYELLSLFEEVMEVEEV